MGSSKSQVHISLCFTNFSSFPKEIQLEIWFQVLPEGQLVYHNSDGPFQPPKPSALYYACPDSREVYFKHYKQLYLHDYTCSLARTGEETYPSFYNPIKDTLVYTCTDHLLLQQIRECCSVEKNLLSQALYIAFVADQKCFDPPGLPTSHNPRYMPLAISPEFGFRLWKYIYEHNLCVNPVVESVTYVVGRRRIDRTAVVYPQLKLVMTLKEFGEQRLSWWKYRNNIAKKYHERTVNEIRSGLEKWKEMHLEVKISRIEMAFPKKQCTSK